MEIIEIKENKKQFLPLLLLADEQESMIDRYIDRGMMYVLVDNGVKCECVVTDEGKGILEIKNIATAPEYQGKGYGKALIDFVAAKYKGKYSILQVGTGDSPLTVPFYEKSGFVRSHSIKNFFIDNYDHPIFEGGVQLTDISNHKICLTTKQKWIHKLISVIIVSIGFLLFYKIGNTKMNTTLFYSFFCVIILMIVETIKNLMRHFK